jgi:predicted permease
MGGAAYDAPSARTALLERAAERLAALPGATAVSATNAAPLSGNTMASAFAVEGRDPADAEARRAETRAVLPGYFAALRLPLVRGRDFTPAEARDTAAGVVIVNEAMAARWWPGQDPIGRRVSFGGAGADAPWRTVVGVARDVRQQRLARAPEEQAYLPFASFARREMTLLVRASGDAAALAPAARRAVAGLDAGLPVVEVETMTAIAHRSLWLPRLYGVLFGAFAGAAVLLAVVGVYGVIAYAVAQRGRELGVRVALGARPRDVARLLLADGARLAALGLGLGLPLALAATGALRSTLHGVSPRDPAVLLATTVLLMAAALLATWVPARRAARVDPITALRAD